VMKENSTIELVAIEGNPGNDNPFGILPFVWPNNGTSNYPETNPMGNQAIEMNAMMSIYLTSGSMQIGQLVLEFPSDQPIGDSVHGLMASIKLPQSNDPEKKPTKASYISPTPDLAGQRQSILTFMSLILDQQSLGVTGAFDGEQTFNSGLDRMIANADVQDAIEVNQEAYRDAEHQIYEIVSTMLGEVNQGFSEENELQIVFRKPKMLITDKEKLENIKLMDDLNMLEPWEKLVIFDPNLSEDEAKKKMSLIEAAKPKPEPMTNGAFNFGNNGRAGPQSSGQSS
jgi:hypothetical protein